MRTLSLLLLICLSLPAYANVSESFVQTYPLSSTGAIHLENVNGPIEIVGWDKNEVHLEAIKSAPTAEDLSRIHLNIESTSERLSVKTEYDKKLWIFGSWKGEVRYRLRVPATAALKKISAINTNIRVQDVRNDVFLNTVNGKIDASGLTASARLETVNGTIIAAYAKINPATKISLRTVNGRCDLTLPKDTPFNVSSKTVNGGVRTDTPIRVEKSGATQFRGGVGEGGPALDFKSVHGELTIHVTKD